MMLYGLWDGGGSFFPPHSTSSTFSAFNPSRMGFDPPQMVVPGLSTNEGRCFRACFRHISDYWIYTSRRPMVIPAKIHWQSLQILQPSHMKEEFVNLPYSGLFVATSGRAASLQRHYSGILLSSSCCWWRFLLFVVLVFDPDMVWYVKGLFYLIPCAFHQF